MVSTTGVDTPDGAQLAAAFNMLCDRLKRQLQPLFGLAATSALFVRALHVGTQEFPWLAEVVPPGGERCSVEGFDSVSRQLDTRTLEEGLAAVLAYDIGLLAALIGEDFVMPLVQEAWANASLVERSAPTEGEP
jgi:hypothetical protein